MRLRRIWQALVIWSVILPIAPVGAPAPQSSSLCEYWVAPPPTGSDDNTGSRTAPWATMEHAARAVPDNACTIWFLPGTYTGDQRISRRFASPVLFKATQPYQAQLQHTGLVVSISGGRNIIMEGFVFRHTGPGANPLVFAVDQSSAGWAEWITLRNNIFHDSFNNDLLKIYNGARYVTVENNLFFNQGEGEEHMDVNSVTDVFIQDNLFFNDFAGSGRAQNNESKQYIVIKDSNGSADGLEGSERVFVRRNVFLNWQGRPLETIIQVGLDGKPYFEAKDVHIESNLILGNGSNRVGAAFGVRGARDVYFVNNTVAGNLPSGAYAFRVTTSDLNPVNRNIFFYNNIWSDPTGTMGAEAGREAEFSDGDPQEVINLVLDRNVYWNGGYVIPPGDVVSPMVDDRNRVLADPLLRSDPTNVVLPRWSGTRFLSGSRTIREEFVRLVELYGQISEGSPAAAKAIPASAPPDDILGRPRGAEPDIGAFESDPEQVEEAASFLPFVLARCLGPR